MELTKSSVGKAVESTTFQFTSEDLFNLLSERHKLLYILLCTPSNQESYSFVSFVQ